MPGLLEQLRQREQEIDQRQVSPFLQQLRSVPLQPTEGPDFPQPTEELNYPSQVDQVLQEKGEAT